MVTKMICLVIARIPGGGLNDLGKMILTTMPFDAPVHLAIVHKHLTHIFPENDFRIICAPANNKDLIAGRTLVQYSIWKKLSVEDVYPKLVFHTQPAQPTHGDHAHELESRLQQYFSADQYMIIKSIDGINTDIARQPESGNHHNLD
ncbi:hypothetical protein LG201_02270 [Methylobacillus gramineus]|uniref:hypothetical protein n=1 Tax=Methylobacillus gramineus TaxID=755169 RepID=UPI001CFFEF60|nr:hypothetical protein [Methylobacillus gramineus]MCB5184024.1 hypothetical protein [Methylobacillus gramineus]